MPPDPSIGKSQIETARVDTGALAEADDEDTTTRLVGEKVGPDPEPPELFDPDEVPSVT